MAATNSEKSNFLAKSFFLPKPPEVHQEKGKMLILLNAS
jgi:hypothetical protein